MQVVACDYSTQETANKDPGTGGQTLVFSECL